MTKEQLIDKLKEIIALHKPELQKHENYDRTVELATLYSQIISGKDIDELLKRFVRREDETMFDQRKELTQQITPAISSTVIKTFNKIFRTAPATEVIDFDGDNVDEKVQKVKEALKYIYGNKDIYKYLQDKFLYLSFVDPNSFIYTAFDNFNPKTEDPEPYNTEITSEQAINYGYFNNILQWLITKVDHVYIEDDKERNGYIYTIYGPEFAFKMIQVGKDYKPQASEIVEKIQIETEKVEFYIFEEYEHKAETIPVIQVGYERDLETMGATFVSPIHPGMPYFMKLVKAVSEFDLTNCLHVFPKLFQYVDSCSFKPDGKCMTSGCSQDRCKQCNNTGIKMHTSAQDALILKLPKTPEDMMDLSKMIHVETPDVALLEFQDALIEKYSTKVQKSIFNSETFTRDEVAKTATGENIDMQNVYDTLKPFAEKISDVWEHIARIVANYLDFKDPIVAHAYPNDFKLKTTPDLLDELTKATQGQAAGYVIASIENDIMRNMYIDAPLEFQKYEAKQKFFPFNGKTKDEINTILLSQYVRPRDIILYTYFEPIFSELEYEFLNPETVDGKRPDPVWFYNLEYMLQKEAIDAKIDEIEQGLPSAQPLDIGEVS